jgi:HK97 family phage prohead protease
MIERRYIKGGEIRAKKGDTPGIAGVAAVYDQKYDAGWFIETIKPGAFARALSEKQDVRCLFNHDVNNLLARTKSGTLRLEDSPGGLTYDADTDPNTTVGRDVAAMIERGDLDGCSFSFTVRKDCWRDEFDGSGKYLASYRDIEDLDLYDVGPVTFPAYTQTSVGIRSAEASRSLWPDGVPAEIRSHVPGLQIAGDKPIVKRARRDAVDGDCVCDCDPCQGGDCTGCVTEDCSAAGCTCAASQRSATGVLELRARAHMLAGLTAGNC